MKHFFLVLMCIGMILSMMDFSVHSIDQNERNPLGSLSERNVIGVRSSGSGTDSFCNIRVNMHLSPTLVLSKPLMRFSKNNIFPTVAVIDSQPSFLKAVDQALASKTVRKALSLLSSESTLFFKRKDSLIVALTKLPESFKDEKMSSVVISLVGEEDSKFYSSHLKQKIVPGDNIVCIGGNNGIEKDSASFKILLIHELWHLVIADHPKYSKRALKYLESILTIRIAIDEESQGRDHGGQFDERFLDRYFTLFDIYLNYCQVKEKHLLQAVRETKLFSIEEQKHLLQRGVELSDIEIILRLLRIEVVIQTAKAIYPPLKGEERKNHRNLVNHLIDASNKHCSFLKIYLSRDRYKRIFSGVNYFYSALKREDYYFSTSFSKNIIDKIEYLHSPGRIFFHMPLFSSISTQIAKSA